MTSGIIQQILQYKDASSQHVPSCNPLVGTLSILIDDNDR